MVRSALFAWFVPNWIWREKHSTQYVKAQFRPNWAISQVHIRVPAIGGQLRHSCKANAVSVGVEPPPCENCGASNYSWILTEAYSTDINVSFLLLNITTCLYWHGILSFGALKRQIINFWHLLATLKCLSVPHLRKSGKILRLPLRTIWRTNWQTFLSGNAQGTRNSNDARYTEKAG